MKYYDFFDAEKDIDVVCEPANLYGERISEKERAVAKRKKLFLHKERNNAVYKKIYMQPGSKKLFKKTASKKVRRQPGVNRKRGLTKKICDPQYYC